MPEYQDKWGRSTAKQRYGDHDKTYPGAPEGQCYPQCPEDKQGPKYNNDTPNNWLRGNGNKPGFNRSK